jgi:hypothetical protein
VEGATLGNIMIQAMAMGRIRDLEEGRGLVKQSCPVNSYIPLQEPDHTSERYEQFLKLKQL